MLLQQIAVVLFLAASAFAQIHVTIKPESLASSKPIFGSGRDVGKWTVLTCNNYPVHQVVDRARILQAAPQVHEIPASETEDQLTRKAAADQRSIIGNVGDQLLGLGGDGATIGGFVSGNNIAEYVGLGMKGLQFFMRIFKTAHAAPDPSPHLSEMLPNVTSLDAGRCDTEKWIIASLVHNAATVDADIWLPGTAPQQAAPPPAPLVRPQEDAALVIPWIYTELVGL